MNETSQGNLRRDECVSSGLEFLKEASNNEYLDESTRLQIRNAYAEVSRLASEDRLRLAVVGEFSAGKSSLINALMGTNILTSDIEPTTAAQTRLTWGPVFQVEVKSNSDIRFLWQPFQPNRNLIKVIFRYRLQYGDMTFLQHDGSMSPSARDLVADFVRDSTTEQARQERVNEVVIHLRSDYLAGAIDILDTPGFNPGLKDEDYQRHLDVTMNAVASSHLALFVIDGRNPLKATEQKFLQAFKPYLSRVFFVVNKMDMILDEDDESEAQDTELYLHEELPSKFGIPKEEVNLYFVSSVKSISPEHKKYTDSITRLREDIVAFMERSREQIVLEKTARHIAYTTGEIHKQAEKRLKEANIRLSELKSMRIFDAESMKKLVFKKALEAYKAESHEFLSRFAKQIENAQKKSVDTFSQKIKRVQKKKDIGKLAKVVAEREFTCYFATPLEKLLVDSLAVCIKFALEAMSAQFAKLYENIDVPQPELPGRNQVKQTAQAMLEIQLHSDQIQESLEGARNAGKGFMKAGVLAGVLIGGPAGLGVAVAGTALKWLFGASKEKLQKKAIDQFGNKLSEVSKQYLQFAQSCVSGQHDIFVDLLTKYENQQINKFEERIEQLIQRQENEKKLMIAAIKSLGQAVHHAKRIEGEATEHANVIRRDLAIQKEWGSSQRNLILDQEAIDSLAYSIFGAVANGATDLPVIARAWLKGDGAKVIGMVDQSRREAINKAAALSVLLSVVFRDKYKNTKWRQSLSKMRSLLDLSALDISLFFAGQSVESDGEAAMLLHGAVNGARLGKLLKYRNLKDAMIVVQNALNEFVGTVSFWEDAVPQHIGQEIECLSNTTRQRAEEEIQFIGKRLKRRRFIIYSIILAGLLSMTVAVLYGFDLLRQRGVFSNNLGVTQEKKFVLADPALSFNELVKKEMLGQLEATNTVFNKARNLAHLLVKANFPPDKIVVPINKRASEYFKKGNYEDAENFWILARTIDPSKAQTYLGLARIYGHQRRKDKLAENLESLKTLGTDEAFMLLKQAKKDKNIVRYRRNRRIRKALKVPKAKDDKNIIMDSHKQHHTSPELEKKQRAPDIKKTEALTSQRTKEESKAVPGQFKVFCRFKVGDPVRVETKGSVIGGDFVRCVHLGVLLKKADGQEGVIPFETIWMVRKPETAAKPDQEKH